MVVEALPLVLPPAAQGSGSGPTRFQRLPTPGPFAFSHMNQTIGAP